MKMALQKQPISFGIRVGGNFNMYSSGIFNGKCGNAGDPLNHDLLMVGWGSMNGVDYWVAKNSWGTSWGEQGYMKIHILDDDSEGICGC